LEAPATTSCWSTGGPDPPAVTCHGFSDPDSPALVTYSLDSAALDLAHSLAHPGTLTGEQTAWNVTTAVPSSPRRRWSCQAVGCPHTFDPGQSYHANTNMRTHGTPMHAHEHMELPCMQPPSFLPCMCMCAPSDTSWHHVIVGSSSGLTQTAP
jgi:hypothetical protein